MAANPFIVDITAQVTPTPDYIQWFGEAAMVAGTLTNDEISTPNISWRQKLTPTAQEQTEVCSIKSKESEYHARERRLPLT